MNKTIYLKEADAPIWERAREIARDRLSPIILDSLRGYVAREEADAAGFERIVVDYKDSDAHGLPRSKAFFGKWIIPPDKPYELTSERGDKWEHYAVAITAKHNLVVYKKCFREVNPEECRQDEFFYTFSSFEEAAADKAVTPAIIAARKRLGVPTEELEI